MTTDERAPSAAMVAAQYERLLSANERLRRERDASREAAKFAVDEALKIAEAQLVVIDQRDEARADRDAIAATLERLRSILDDTVGCWPSEQAVDQLLRLSQQYGEALAELKKLRPQAAHKAPTTTPPSTLADQNPPVPQEGTGTPQAVQDDPGGRERVSGGVDLMAALRASIEKARATRRASNGTAMHGDGP